jgi:hypothetical protein
LDNGYQPRDLYIFEKVQSSFSDWIIYGVQLTNGDYSALQMADTSADINLLSRLPFGFITNQHRYYAREEFKLRNMQYSIKEAKDKSISLTLPYIPYTGFKATRGYQHGLFYEDYIRALMHLIHRLKYRTGDAFREFKSRMFTEVGEQRVDNHTLKLEISTQVSHVQIDIVFSLGWIGHINCTPYPCL